ncbi:MAG: outer membrane beta-barrel protein [Planctomycetes bacterium]|nr:outer membrane beta-barrel protein [Planctomycetota bacterium]
MTTTAAVAQQAGSIRGMVYDKDFDAPLPLAQVLIAETGEKVVASDEGNYVFGQVVPGKYTLVFSKDGYTRVVKADVVVSPGQLTEVNVQLTGDFTDMEEFIVQDLQIGGGSEQGLLNLRFEAPQLLDSVGADLMSRAGASDAAAALKLVSGATVQDGKYAVVRGLPDRYVNSQMNGVRLPTADPDKRAVQLDQFPSAVIESIQVSKTFTPDQQGDASGGAVNVVLKGLPTQNIFSVSTEYSANTQVTGKSHFLSDQDGLSFFGIDDGSRNEFATPSVSRDAVGPELIDAPIDYKWNMGGGGKIDLEDGFKLGGFANFYYKHDSSFYDNGIDDQLWSLGPHQRLSPQFTQGMPDNNVPQSGSFNTSLLDVTQGSEEVQWGGLGTIGLESEFNSVNVLYMYNRTTDNTDTIAEDTRGKAYYFPGYNPNNPTDPGNQSPQAAPYHRNETLQYTERSTETLQFHGEHKLPIDPFGSEKYFTILPPEFDWTYAISSSTLYQPDKRLFGEQFFAPAFNPGFPPFVPPFTTPNQHLPFKPAANFTVGNLQRVWKDISEDSDQYFVNLKFPFRNWTGQKGYVKLGYFNDHVQRSYDQNSYSNFGDNAASTLDTGPFESRWSQFFPWENHVVSAADIDVDYTGDQKITAWYTMADMPLTEWFRLIGGVRFEKTELSIVNQAEKDATWIPPSSGVAVKLNPGDADVDFRQNDVLPAIGFVFSPFDKFTIRGNYAETIARQTFKELSPIQQQEYLGSDVFVGNPDLTTASLKNYDLRFDYKPYQGGLVSVSYFYKQVKDPIEYVQAATNEFVYTTAENFPKGRLRGFEFEVRQDLEQIWDELHGLSIGGNATLIDSEVTLPPNPFNRHDSRPMTNAPEYLYNIFMTYDVETTGTQFTVFYTVKGDTLIAGADPTAGSIFIPNVYAAEYGTLNFTVTQKLGKYFKVKFQAKNLTNPDIETYYQSGFGPVTKTSHTNGIDLSISIGADFNF